MNERLFIQALSLLLAAATLLSYTSLGIAQSTGTFTPTGDMTIARQFHTATLLGNGKVLIVGGAAASLRGDLQSLTTAELYDPGTGTFTPTGKLNTPLWGVTATLLNDGQVLIVGSDASRKCAPNSAEIYDPVTGTLSNTAGSVTGQVGRRAILLHDGRVLVAGGAVDCRGWETPIANPELYDPSTGAFVATGRLCPHRATSTTPAGLMFPQSVCSPMEEF